MATTDSEESLSDGCSSDFDQLDGNTSDQSLSEGIASDSSSDSQHKAKQRVQEKRKQVKRKSLGEAVSAILRLPVKQEATTAPSVSASKSSKPVVLSRRRAPERKLAEARLEAAARRLLRAERHAKRDQHHQPSMSDLNREKRLRQVATRGVVQVFNAVSAKTKAEKKDAVKKEVATLPDRRKESAPAAVGKEAELKMSFLELLKANMSTR